jgi:hypothetical protein
MRCNWNPSLCSGSMNRLAVIRGEAWSQIDNHGWKRHEHGALLRIDRDRITGSPKIVQIEFNGLF